MKKIVYLNNDWLFTKGFETSFLEPDFNAAEFATVSLPHNNIETPLNYFDDNIATFVCTYFKEFHIPNSYAENKIIFNAEGILQSADVYLNGELIASNAGEIPFSCDVSDKLKYGGDNRIIIKVNSKLKKEILYSEASLPLINYGGIHRGISLDLYKTRLFKEVFIKANDCLAPDKILEISVELFDKCPDSFLKVQVLDGKGIEVNSLHEKAVLGVKTSTKGVVSGVKLWDIENPIEYTAKVSIIKDGTEVDFVVEKFGFRSAEFKRDGFYLNGNKLKLIGLNRVDSYPYLGRAMTADLQREDAQIMRYKLGLNVVRLTSLASRDFILECDKIGLMVISDLGGDGYIGNAKWRDNLLENIKGKIRRDINSPSIIAWGTRINNSVDNDELYFKTNKAVKELDNSRQTLGARNFMGSHLYEDVFGYNDYPDKSKPLTTKLVKTGKLFVPYLITEHTGKNFPTKSFDSEEINLRHALQHLNVIDNVFASKKISGAIGMCFSDFNTQNQKGGGDNICYTGVTDMYRNLKLAGWAYASQFSKETVLEPSSDMSTDEFFGKLYIFTNCDYVKLYRNKEEAGVFYPDKKTYRNLPHPPIVISDFSGDLVKLEKFTASQSKLFKYLVDKTNGAPILNISGLKRLVAWYLRKSLKLDYSAFVNLFDKYSIENSPKTDYKIVGFKDGKEVNSKKLGKNIKKGVKVLSGENKIICTTGFETKKIIVEVVGENDERLKYLFSAARVETSGAVKLAGSKKVQIVGGIVSFYLKTIKKGTGGVGIEFDDGQKVTLDLEVVYESMENI